MRRSFAWLVVCLAAAVPGTAMARDPEPDPWGTGHSLLQRVGIDVVRRLVRGDLSDPGAPHSEMMRGIQRAAAIGTEDGVLVLTQLLADPHGVARSDPRVLLAVTRALAPYASQRAVSRALTDAALNAPSAQPGRPGNPPEEALHGRGPLPEAAARACP